MLTPQSIHTQLPGNLPSKFILSPLCSFCFPEAVPPHDSARHSRRSLALVERSDQVFSGFGNADAGTGDVRARPGVEIVGKNSPAI